MTDEIPMTPGRMDCAVQRLREATTNYNALDQNLIEDAREGATEREQQARFADAAHDSQETRQAIEDVALGVVGEVFRDRFKYSDVEDAIKTAGAEWLYSVILERALDALEGGDA